MKNTPVNRFYVRKRCAKLGLPVPEWARKQRRGRPRIHPIKPKAQKRGRPRIHPIKPKAQKRGRPATLTPEERKYKERVYNHAYYMRVTKKKRRQMKELAKRIAAQVSFASWLRNYLASNNE